MSYRIQWRGQRVLYFEHAPPQFGKCIDVPQSEYPLAPFPGAHLEQHSIYYWWWAFLRENRTYAEYCDAKGKGGPLPAISAQMLAVFEDFGELGADFKDWWQGRNKRLKFCLQLEREIHHGQSFATDADTYGPSNRILISVPADGDPARVRAEVQKLVDYYFPHRKTSGTRNPPPKYPVLMRRTRTTYLSQILLIHQLVANQSKKLKNREIADALKLDWEDSQVIRAKRKAIRCIANVGEGRFPDFS